MTRGRGHAVGRGQVRSISPVRGALSINKQSDRERDKRARRMQRGEPIPHEFLAEAVGRGGGMQQKALPVE
jgi:hypothetical protein